MARLPIFTSRFFIYVCRFVETVLVPHDSRGDFMKRKPDVMTTLIVVFCLGLVVSGVVSFERSIERPSVQLTMAEPGEEIVTR